VAQTTVHVRSAHEGTFSVGWSERHSLVIDRSPDDGGQGMGFNGGQLLLLALGSCYANDVFREAIKRDLEVLGVRVVVECDWVGDPQRAENVRFSTRVEAAADEEEILELIRHVDEIAEIHNTLRQGIDVELVEAEAVSVQIEARAR
jgi:putative redox protein